MFWTAIGVLGIVATGFFYVGRIMEMVRRGPLYVDKADTWESEKVEKVDVRNPKVGRKFRCL
jgi:hypothetical protein